MPKNTVEKDAQIELILEETKQGNINWKFGELKEPSWAHWIIDFTANWRGKHLYLKREHCLVSGGWISEKETSLKIGGEEPVTFNTQEDYVETLYQGGASSVSALAMILIEKFRKQKNLHWSIM